MHSDKNSVLLPHHCFSGTMKTVPATVQVNVCIMCACISLFTVCGAVNEYIGAMSSNDVKDLNC